MKVSISIDLKYALFLVAVMSFLLWDLGTYGLAETSEARYAEIAREMYLSKDYINPTLLGIFHFHKPPITYYITALGYHLFGINEFGARFFMQLAVVIQLIMVYLLTNLLLKNKKLSFTAGLIYFSMPLVLISSRNLTTDAYLTTFILAALTSWQFYTNKGKILFLYLFYILVGVALLTKGPVALLFIVIYIVVFKLLMKSGLRITLHHCIGFILCFALGASWYFIVAYQNPKLWDYFVHKQVLSRINADAFNRSKPFWYYLPIVFGLLLPWLVGLLPSLRRKLKRPFKHPKELQVLWISVLLLLAIFSAFTTKLIMYILPAFWMLAILIAFTLSTASLKTRKVIEFTYFFQLLTLMIGIFFCWYLEYDFLNITQIDVFLNFCATCIVFAIFYLLKNKTSLRTPVLATCFSLVLLTTANGALNHNNDLINAMRDEVSFIEAKSLGKKPQIIVYDYLLSSIPFYSGTYQVTLKDSHNTTDREIQFQNGLEWKKILLDVHNQDNLDDLKILANQQNTFLLIRKKRGLSEDLSFLKKSFNSKKTTAKWIILYHS